MRTWPERLEFWSARHTYVLGRKGVTDGAALRAAIRHDLFVATAAARTLFSGATADVVLEELVADRVDVLRAVIDLVDGERVDHIGFQVSEPMDVFLEGVNHWAPRLDCELVGGKRFTASEPFRRRVGAFVEMAQVWLRHGDTTVELEVFDIHRPNPPSADGARSIDGSTRALLSTAQPGAMRSALADDDIWHYGVRIVDDSAVERLHERFRALCREDDRFRLRSDRTVANPWHGSVHTKLTNLELAIEVEFLTYRVDWQRRS